MTSEVPAHPRPISRAARSPPSEFPEGRRQKSLGTPDLLSGLHSLVDGSPLLCPPMRALAYVAFWAHCQRAHTGLPIQP